MIATDSGPYVLSLSDIRSPTIASPSCTNTIRREHPSNKFLSFIMTAKTISIKIAILLTKA